MCIAGNSALAPLAVHTINSPVPTRIVIRICQKAYLARGMGWWYRRKC